MALKKGNYYLNITQNITFFEISETNYSTGLRGKTLPYYLYILNKVYIYIGISFYIFYKTYIIKLCKKVGNATKKGNVFK